MPIDARLLTPKIMQVTLGLPPSQLNTTSLRHVFTDLSRYDYETFVATPEGGAIIGSPRKQKHLQILPVSRTITLPIELTPARAIDEIVDCLQIIEAHFPVSSYVFVQSAYTAQLPVTGETAAELLDRTALSSRSGSFALLGPDRLGSGLKIFMSGGRSSLAIEPLIQDAGLLFIQYVTVQQGQIQASAIKGILDALIRYVENQVKGFITQALGEG